MTRNQTLDAAFLTLGVKLPLHTSRAECGVILDADGQDVLTVDSNGFRPDDQVSAIAALVTTCVNQSPNGKGWQDMESAPREGSIIVWWPIVKLDEYGDPTDAVESGQAVVSEWNGGCWLEPDVLNAIGDHMGDDFTYADGPSHWMPLPAAPIAVLNTTEGLAE